MLESIIVDVEDVALMYEDGLDKYLRYTTAIEMFEDGYHPIQIAEHIDTDYSLVRYWLIGKETPKGHRKGTPHPVKAINRLGDLLPLSYDHLKFGLVNLIAGWAFWSGKVKAGKNAVIFCESKDKLGVLAQIFDDLGYGYKFPEKRKNILTSDFGLAKLLYLMGLPTNRKSLSQATIPHHILSLLEFKEDEDNVAVIKDFLSTLLYLRTHSSYPDFLVVYGITKRNPKTLEKETKELCELMKLAGLDFHVVEPTPPNLIPRFTIRKDAIIDFIKGSSLGGYVKNLEKELE